MNNNIDWNSINNNTLKFSLNGLTIKGKVVSVYDGDTINIVLPFHLIFGGENKFYKFTCRLINVDTPEIRTKNLQEKEYAIKVRDYLREKILNEIVTIKCYDFDKYGRLLIEVFLNNQNINNWLIENQYAKKYDGGTKTKWFV